MNKSFSETPGGSSQIQYLVILDLQVERLILDTKGDGDTDDVD